MNRNDTIETLQMDVNIPDVVQKKANETFDKIRTNKATVGADTNIIPYSTKQTKGASTFPKRRIGVIAVVATLALATVSVAAAYLNWSKSLSEGLQATDEQKVQMEENNMATFVNQASTVAGITVTAVQSITDNYYTHIAFKVEGYELGDGVQPDFETTNVTVNGKDDINSCASFYNGLIQGTDGKIANADGTPFDTDENGGIIEHYVMDDGSLEYQITLFTHEKGYFINKLIHVELSNLGTVSKAEYFNEINGTWSFDWNLQGSEDMKECSLNVPLGDTNATVVKAELSPISLRVEYEFPRQEVTETALDEMSEEARIALENGEEMPETALNENSEEASINLNIEPPQLTGVKMKDGTLYPFLYLGPGTMGYVSEDSDLYMTAFAIDRIIDVEQVESLLFIKSYPENEEPLSEDNFYEVPIE